MNPARNGSLHKAVLCVGTDQIPVQVAHCHRRKGDGRFVWKVNMGDDRMLGVINNDIDKLNDGYDPKDGKDGDPEDWADPRFCLERIVEARDRRFPSVGKRDVPYHRTDAHSWR